MLTAQIREIGGEETFTPLDQQPCRLLLLPFRRVAADLSFAGARVLGGAAIVLPSFGDAIAFLLACLWRHGASGDRGREAESEDAGNGVRYEISFFQRLNRRALNPQIWELPGR